MPNSVLWTIQSTKKPDGVVTVCRDYATPFLKIPNAPASLFVHKKGAMEFQSNLNSQRF